MKHAKTGGISSIDERYQQGAAFIRTNEYDKAAAIFSQIIAEKPDHLGSLEYLAHIARELGNLEGSINLLKAIVNIAPLYSPAQRNLAGTLKQAGRVKQARDVMALAHQLNPQDIVATSFLGDLYLELGDQQKAEEFYLRGYETTGNPLNLCNYILLQYKIKSKDDPYFQALRKLERREAKLDENSREDLHYTLAKAWKDLKEYDQSFQHLLTASVLKRSTIKFKPDLYLKWWKTTQQFFSADLLERYREQALDSRQPVFVVGMPRSGSTLIDQILYSHSDVESIGESALLPNLMIQHAWLPEHNGIRFPTVPSGQPAKPQHLGREYLNRIASPASGAQRVIDKHLFNYPWIGMIRIMFPNAKIIHMKRNPLDCCLSCFSYKFIGGTVAYSYDLTELGLVYRAYAELMEHWHREFPSAILDVVYEDVINDFDPQVRRILDYLELPWDDNCLRFYESERHVKTVSLTQVRQPIYKTSAGGWQKYARHLGPLIEALGPYAPEGARKMGKTAADTPASAGS